MSNKKNRNKKKKGLQKKNRKKNLKSIKNNSTKSTHSTKLSSTLEETNLAVDKKSDDLDIPSFSLLGTPGIRPIPDAGMNHNVMKQQKYLFQQKTIEKKPKRRWSLLLLRFLLLIGFLFLFYYFVFIKSNEKERILTCMLKEYDEEEKIDNVSVLRYLFENGTLVQTVDEESIVFSEESLNHYSSFEKSLQEWVEEEKDAYDNVRIEIKNTENSIKAIYVVDLTADPNNPKNDLAELGYTYSQLKKELIEEGYSCK